MPEITITDEETPLLRGQPHHVQHTHLKTQKTPLPWRQFSILLLVQVSEPLTSQVIAPFLPQLIRDIGITDGEDSRVGYYVGFMHSLFFLTEACTTFYWSRLSDQIGRKPVLLTGLFGLSMSMWCFGLSKTFWGLVLSRCLSGALNGNVGVMKSMTIDLTDSTNIAQAFGILPLTWTFGITVGPMIGGSLANPVERFPNVFGNSVFFKEYPYFLPCSVVATFTILSWITAFVFMKETTKHRKTLRQYLFGGSTNISKPRSGPEVNEAANVDPESNSADEQLPLRSLLVRPVLVAAGSYAMFCLVDISVRAIIPVFYAMPIELGGLHLGPPAIGTILAILGVSAGVVQWMFFAPMHGWLGPKRVFVTTICLYLPMIALFPVINAAARVYGLNHFVWFLVGLQTSLSLFTGFGFGTSFMYIGAAAPNKASIGATNGIAQTTVSVMRAFGPAVVNSTFSFSIEKNIMGGNLAYLVMLSLVGLTLWVVHLLPENLKSCSR